MKCIGRCKTNIFKQCTLKSINNTLYCFKHQNTMTNINTDLYDTKTINNFINLYINNNITKLTKDDKLLMWSYSRIDTVKRPEILKLVRKAGIRWLCLGIESGDKAVRLEVAKGKFEDVDVKKVIKKVHEADINVMANYIYEAFLGSIRNEVFKYTGKHYFLTFIRVPKSN